MDKLYPRLIVLAILLAASIAAAPHEVIIDGVRYVPAPVVGGTPVTQPATVPATLPATVPTVPVVPSRPAGIHVAPGESWAAAVQHAKPGDTVWLAASGVWTEPVIDPALRLDRVTIAAYGAGAAPTVRVKDGSALVLYRPRDVSILGIRFESEKPTNSGVRIFAGERIALDGCAVSGFTFGVTVEAFQGKRSSDITIKHSDISRNWNPNGDSSGMFASATDRLTLDHCKFDANGWREGVSKGSIRNHNVYLAGDCTATIVRGCEFSRASSHGLQARAGGQVFECIFRDNPIHLSFGLVNGGGPITPGGVTGSVKSNAFAGTRPLAGEPRGWAIECGNVRDAEIVGNTFDATHTFDPTKQQVAAIVTAVCRLDESHPQKSKVVKILKLRIDGNTGRWPGGLLRQGAAATALTGQGGF